MSPETRLVQTTVEEFKELLKAGKIRPASLEDVNGTHHTRALYKHPNTKAWFVAI